MQKAFLVCEKCYTRYKRRHVYPRGTRLTAEREMQWKRCGNETCYDVHLECGVGYLILR